MMQFLGGIAKATGLFNPQQVKKDFVTQINNWAPYDFVQYCNDKKGGDTWDPPDKTNKECPPGWEKNFLDED